MEQRLVELRKPPIDINSALGLPPKEDKDKMVEVEVTDEVKKNAHDLSGLVRKKRKAEDAVETGDKGAEVKKIKEGESAPAETEAPVPAVEA